LNNISLQITKKIFQNLLIQSIILIMMGTIVLSQLNSQAKDIYNWLFPTATSTAEIENIIISELQEINELTTADMKTRATVKVSQERKVSRFTLGNTNVIYEGVGKVRAGIDLTKLQVKQVDLAQHKIQILLPPPHLSEVFLDLQASNLIDSYKKWFGPNTNLQLQDEAQKKALELIKTEACIDKKILESANTSAKNIVEQILTKAGFETIVIETQSPQASNCSLKI
jgi:hypothetical protein